MNTELLHDLANLETDIEGVMRRFSYNETLYVNCLRHFLADESISLLETAIREGMWDDAFTAAHALKGLSANMGFVPLSHASAELVVVIRSGRIADVGSSFAHIKRCYRELSAVITQYCPAQPKGGEQ